MRLVTFAHGAVFEASAEKLRETAEQFGHEQEIFSISDVAEQVEPSTLDYLQTNGTISGAMNLHFAWKPILLQAISHMSEEGEVIVYSDSSKYFKNGWTHNPTIFLDLFTSNDKTEKRWGGGNGFSLYMGPHFDEFKISGFSSTKLKSIIKASELLDFSFSKSDWTQLPQALASPVVFVNNDESREIIRDWTRLATETNFFFENLREDQAALNILSLKHRIGSLCMNQNKVPSFNPSSVHPAWAKNHNLVLSLIADEGIGHIIMTEPSVCRGESPTVTPWKYSWRIFLKVQILRATYWKLAHALISDGWDTLVGRIRPSLFFKHHFGRR